MPKKTSGTVALDANTITIISGTPTSVLGNQTKQPIFTGFGVVGAILIASDVTNATCSLYDSDNNVLLNSVAGKFKIDALGNFHGGIMGMEFNKGLKITTENFAGGNLIIVYC